VAIPRVASCPMRTVASAGHTSRRSARRRSMTVRTVRFAVASITRVLLIGTGQTGCQLAEGPNEANVALASRRVGPRKELSDFHPITSERWSLRVRVMRVTSGASSTETASGSRGSCAAHAAGAWAPHRCERRRHQPVRGRRRQADGQDIGRVGEPGFLVAPEVSPWTLPPAAGYPPTRSVSRSRWMPRRNDPVILQEITAALRHTS
jgi:hypothetical protein